MAGAASSMAFKWLDLLENEFDKSFVDLDLQIGQALEDDEEGIELHDSIRKLLSNMANCFVQLSHKAQTIFQDNAKLEAELVHLREEKAKSKVYQTKVKSEKMYLICCLQSALLENHKLKLPPDEGDANLSDEDICADIQMRLSREIANLQKVDWDTKRLEDKCKSLESENEKTRKVRNELESELIGARLDAKYLDKELAGRIQQIQILLAANTSQEHKQRVWAHIESEMHLQRSKTISNMCYSKQKIKDAISQSASDTILTNCSSVLNGEQGKEPSPRSTDATRRSSTSSLVCNFLNHDCKKTGSKFKQVHLHKHDADDLGMAILGGKEHGLPIMISEIFPNSSVGRCKKMCAGDVIIAVNGDTFEEMTHEDAVRYLSSLRGTIIFDLENTIESDIDLIDSNSYSYKMYDPELKDVNCSGKRSPVQRLLLDQLGKKSHHSKQKTRQLSCGLDLPQVHLSPSKKDSAKE